jgi:hypothetical protein
LIIFLISFLSPATAQNSDQFETRTFDALTQEGADVKFTLYPNANHHSWEQAFAEPELLSWLFSHEKYERID